MLCSCSIWQNKTVEQSIWRDAGVADKKSKYKPEKRCDKIIGTIDYNTVVHKGFIEPDIFNGMALTNSMNITPDSAFYLDMYGTIKDKGSCNCENGILTVEWFMLFKRTIEYEIYFNSKKSVELRYLDYYKDMDYYFTGDSSYLVGTPNNPTKIIGTLKPD
jgi:hypothetical protein